MTVELGYGDLAIAATLVLANALLSLVLSLGLTRRILISGLRCAVQLSLVGVVLRAVFASGSPWVVLAVAVVMFSVAAQEAVARQEARLGWGWAYGIGGGTMTLTTGAVVVMALTTQLRPDPWYDPRYVVPLLGIVLGAVMTGVSLGLNVLTTQVGRDRAAIEARLALGADRFVALRPFIARSLRSALIPSINTMASAGIVALPGMMTGQILAGMDPGQAVNYQIFILFLLFGATGLATAGAVYLAAWRLTDSRHRLRLDRLHTDR